MTRESKILWFKNLYVYNVILYMVLSLVSFFLLQNNVEHKYLLLLTVFFTIEGFKNTHNAILSIRNRWVAYYNNFPLFKFVRWIAISTMLILIMNYQPLLNNIFYYLSIAIAFIIGFFTFDTIREIIEKSKEFKYYFKPIEAHNEFKDFLTKNSISVGEKFDNINGYIDTNIHMYSVDKEDFYDDVYTGSTFGSKNSLNVIDYKGKVYKLDDIKSYLKEQNMSFHQMNDKDWNIVDMLSIH